jgi:hypothetical protein
MSKHIARIAALAAWLAVAASAHASPLLELAGTLGGPGGQQARHVPGGAAASYFNPALLVDAPTGLTFGFLVLGTRVVVDLYSRGDGRFDVPPNLENGAHADGSRWDAYPFGTEVLQRGREASPSTTPTSARPRQGAGSGKQTNTYEAVGIVAKFFDERLAFGFYGLIPNATFTRLTSFYADEREQYSSNSLHPELYGDRLFSLAFAFGAGLRLSDSFSLGLGSAISLRASALTPVYVADASKLQDLILNMDARVNVGFSPHGGFAWRPTPRLHFSGTLHGPQEIVVKADIKYLLASGLEQTAAIQFVYDWMPWQVGLGSSFDLVQRDDATLTLAASAVYGRWSRYVDRHAERPVPQFAWRDTITASLGTRARFDGLGVALDLQYKPTPVALQYGRSNYVDNDRIGTSLGADYTFELLGTSMSLGLQGQAYWLLERHTKKLTPPTFDDGVNRTPSLVKDEVPDDGQVGGAPIPGAAGLQTNNPGWPGFASRGWIATIGLYVTVAL